MYSSSSIANLFSAGEGFSPPRHLGPCYRGLVTAAVEEIVEGAVAAAGRGFLGRPSWQCSPHILSRGASAVALESLTGGAAARSAFLLWRRRRRRTREEKEKRAVFWRERKRGEVRRQRGQEPRPHPQLVRRNQVHKHAHILAQEERKRKSNIKTVGGGPGAQCTGAEIAMAV